MSITTTQQIGPGATSNLNPEQHAFIVQWLQEKAAEEGTPPSVADRLTERMYHQELGAGFRALRRSELIQLCNDKKVQIQHNTNKDDILLQIEGHWRNGAFTNGASADADFHAYRNILKKAGYPWNEVKSMTKDEMLAAIARGRHTADPQPGA